MNAQDTTSPRAHDGVPKFRFAARSDTGQVRKNNQDSGYAGAHFLLIADGMGGHAGGDVASAIAVSRLTHLDEPDPEGRELKQLEDAVLAANDQIGRAVIEQPELAGMGTTVTALLQSGDQLALAHIGDSRAMVMHKGEITQVTHDHTFVQMLVDEGRITLEEADTHPQRSVVMRVLGDVGTKPELDMSFHDAVAGDRWLLCSDGLTGFASLPDIHDALATIADPSDCCEKLIELALDGGGGDNITVVIGDVLAPDDDADIDDFGEAVGSVRINPSYAFIGSAAGADTGEMEAVLEDTDSSSLETQPMSAEEIARVLGDHSDSLHGSAASTPSVADDADTVPLTPPGDAGDDTGDGAGSAEGSRDGDLTDGDGPGQVTATSAAASTAVAADAGDPQRAASDDPDPEATAAPRSARSAVRDGDGWDEDADLADWGDDPQPRRRPWIPILITVIVAAVVAVAAFAGWRYVQSQYYVAVSDGSVAVYQGLPQSLGPLNLSSLDETSDVTVTDLSTFSQQRLEATIPADSRDAAIAVVDTLRTEAIRNSSAMSGDVVDQTGQDPAPSPPREDAPEPTDVTGGVTDESGLENSSGRATIDREETSR